MSVSPFVALQYLLPKHALTAAAGWAARSRAPWWTRTVIPWFIRRYGVNMDEAANPDPHAYASFNEFFSRPLRAGVRPLAPDGFVCPVDGAISQLGAIEQDHIFQAKGHRYTTRALLGGSSALAAPFRHGHFATIYLSPKDYHRIHMPSPGRLRRMIYVPGDLFSVNPQTAEQVPGLFARNERVVCLFDVPHGPDGQTRPFAMVLVGATIVGSMATAWHGVVNPPRTRQPREWVYDHEQHELQRGEEMGCFLLGSTVVMLWPKDTIEFQPHWTPGTSVRMGESMGSFVVS